MDDNVLIIILCCLLSLVMAQKCTLRGARAKLLAIVYTSNNKTMN